MNKEPYRFHTVENENENENARTPSKKQKVFESDLYAAPQRDL